MGGYNSLVEVLSARKPVVVCPRVKPRKEQLIRSRILEQLGLARLVRLDHGGARKLSQAILSTLAGGPPTPQAWDALDLGGAARVAEEVLAVEAPVLAGALP
jgi:predicted glycosyltransferase